MVLNTALREAINSCSEDHQDPSIEALYGTFKNRHEASSNPSVKVYKKRYFIMLLYGLCTMFNGFQWIQFSILTSILECYYNVGVEYINWTGLLFMAMFVPFVVPVSWMMSVKGLRLTLVIAALGNVLTSCVQCVSTTPDKFYIVMIAQTIAAIGQCFSISVPSYVAAVWFPPAELSRACAVGVFFNLLGVALGFIIPPLLVPNHCHDLHAVRKGLWILALGQAIANLIVYVLIVLFFEDKPPLPPSVAEAKKPEKPDAILKSVCRMLRDINFCMLIIAYGLMQGVSNAISTLLNQLVVKIFPGEVVAAGWIGLATIFIGMFGSLVWGYILDKTRMYRLCCMVVCGLATICVVSYTFLSSLKILWLHGMMFGLIGFFMMGYMPLAYEFAAEITYPEPEGTSASILIGVLSLLGIIITHFGSWLQQTYGNMALNVFFCSLCVAGCVLTAFIKCKPKRCIQDENTEEPLINPS